MVLLKAGLPLLLRYALDESIETVVIAAVQTMHSLLVIPSEEVHVYTISFICSLDWIRWSFRVLAPPTSLIKGKMSDKVLYVYFWRNMAFTLSQCILF